jgi:hypothetical protein
MNAGPTGAAGPNRQEAGPKVVLRHLPDVFDIGVSMVHVSDKAPQVQLDVSERDGGRMNASSSSRRTRK